MLSAEIDQLDRCAACSEVIAFTQLGQAICRAGHEWCKLRNECTNIMTQTDIILAIVRCSVTLNVLSTAKARTCLVCGRKSEVPDAAVESADETQAAARFLLLVAKHCLFCGGRWTMGH